MAKNGTIKLIHASGEVGLFQAYFEDEDLSVYTEAEDQYRVKWKNINDSSDKGDQYGPGLPYTVGYSGPSGAAGVQFSFGETYEFKVYVYSVKAGFWGRTKWRRIDAKPQMTINEPVVEPDIGTVDPPPPPPPEKQPDWLTPILNQMMT